MGAIEALTRSTIYSIGVQFAGTPLMDLRKQVVEHGIEIDRSADYGIYGITNPASPKKITLIGVTLADLGLKNGASNKDATKAAELHGLAIPPQETALLLACMSGMNFSGAGVIVMSRAIQSLAKATDSILLGVVDGGHHRTLCGVVGAPRYHIPTNALLLFMKK